MRKKSLWRIFVCGVCGGAVCLLLALVQFKGNAVKQEGELYLSSQMTYAEVEEALWPYTKHHLAFRLYAQRLNLSERFKAGHYTLQRGMSVIDLVRMLKLGVQTPVRVTLNHVRTSAQLAGRLARQLEADSVAFYQALTSPALAKELGFDSVTLFSMFLPDSYEVWWTTTPEEFVRRMKREYDTYWSEERDARRKRSGLSRLGVMTLASIVHEETAKGDEMPRVAGVYINRLRRGIPLQADPTVKYALQDFSLRRILYKHLRYDSPYNTYKHRGLPPSPICMPSKQAIEAVLNYEQHDYIFFCARPSFDGYHNFARTLSEHNANARAYQRELNRRKIK